MLNIYDVLEKLIEISGIIGRIFVWIGLISGCILAWYFILKGLI
tara:strand:- start:1269 stop:1400 length:132 start_codon:yes stop_codon:yes gene_type:complete